MAKKKDKEVLEEVKQETPKESTLYYFYSVGCGYCKKADPIVDELIADGHDILKLDLAEADNRGLKDEISKKYNKQCGTPWFIDAENGNQVCGYREKDVLEKWVNGEDIPAPPRPKSPPPKMPFHGATKKEENYIMEYIAAWINKLKTERAYGQAYVQMGWQDGQVIEGSSDNEIEFHTSFILGRRKFTAGGVAELPFEEGIGKLISGGENSIIEDDYIKNATNVKVASISSSL